MTNFNSTPNFIFGASERELLTLSLAEIADGLMADYKSFSRGNKAGISIPESRLEPRMAHACTLYAEGLRLAHTHKDLARKLMLACLFDFSAQAYYWLKVEERAKEAKKEIDLIEKIANISHYSTRAFNWLKENRDSDLLKNLFNDIKAFEDYKAVEREKEEKKKEEETKKLKGQA